MDLRRLRYFVAAAEEENFHRAAERLHIAQPALSKQVALLESELGCALFLRQKGRVRLSAVGRLLLDDGRRILREIDQVEERVRQAARGQLGTLRIGFRETAGRSLIVSRSFGRFRSTNPGVELRLQQMTSPAQSAALRSGELDVGFIYLSPRHDRDLARIPVAEDRYYLVLQRAHPLARQETIRLRDLVDEPFVWLTRSSNAYYADTLLRTCLDGGLNPRITQEADSEATIMNLVAVGMGAGFVVAPAAQSPNPGVVFRPVQELDSVLTLALVWREENGSPLVQAFVDVVRAIANG